MTLVIFASISPFFIKRCSASMFNISLLSQIFWSYLVDEVIFGDSAPKGIEYYIGFIVIIFGIITFHWFPHEVTEIHKMSTEIKSDSTINGEVKSIHSTHSNKESSFHAEKKYIYYRNGTLSSKAHKILHVGNDEK